jgi:hypothetical protein
VRSFACCPAESSPTSSRKSVPPLACSRIARAVDCLIGACPPGTLVVNHFPNQTLACTGLPQEEYWSPHPRSLDYELPDFFHGWTVAQQICQTHLLHSLDLSFSRGTETPPGRRSLGSPVLA